MLIRIGAEERSKTNPEHGQSNLNASHSKNANADLKAFSNRYGMQGTCSSATMGPKNQGILPSTGPKVHRHYTKLRRGYSQPANTHRHTVRNTEKTIDSATPRRLPRIPESTAHGSPQLQSYSQSQYTSTTCECPRSFPRTKSAKAHLSNAKIIAHSSINSRTPTATPRRPVRIR